MITMNNPYKIFISALFLSPMVINGQKVKKDSVREIQEVVVSGNTFTQKAKDVPIPIKVIGKKEIERVGSRRLSDILREQTGLVVANDHGTGLQMQGLSSEYTPILINGEPMLGRMAGTFNLDRVTIGNIKQIEIVKGPSSSLFGSDALAGVINIITDEPQKDHGSISLRAGTNTTLDFNGALGIVRDKFYVDISANRYSSQGYGFQNDRYQKVVNPFENYTYSARVKYKASPKLDLEVLSRFNYSGVDGRTKNQADIKFVDKSQTNDYNIAPRLTWRPNEKITSAFRFYLSGFHNDSSRKREGASNNITETFYRENYYKGENFTDIKWKDNLKTTVGIGGTTQGVASSNLYNEKKWVSQYYGLAQVAYSLINQWNIVLGARYDYNTAFGSQFNPKLAMDYKVGKWLTLRTSVGRGFKAPDFRQLYINFTNTNVGYSVVGAKELKDKLEEMNGRGEIAEIYLSPDKIAELKSERSWAYNFGVEVRPYSKLKLGANLFRNNIDNMIGSVAVARKTNDRNVFSYTNLQKIFTQGIETEFSWLFSKSFELSGGYQYLEAKNQEIIDKIKRGELVGKNDNNETIRIKEQNYYGIVNRSKHTFNAKLFYQNSKGTFANFRAIYRGPHGYRDTDSNGIVNNKSELTSGYLVMHASMGQTFSKRYTLQLGVDNIANYKKPEFYSEFAGRLFWINMKVDF